MDGKNLVRADGFHGFWHLVVGTGRNVQAGSDLVKRLVVARVNVGAATSELEQAAFRGYVDVVGRKVARGILGVFKGLPRVFRQVLVDRTTKGNIDKLHSPTNSHDCLVCGHGLFKQGDFELVPL